MRVFALSDPHLGSLVDKPMDRFGPHWAEHPAKIERGWRATVGEADLVLVPGDISWAMRLEEALPDLRFLGALPGKKVLLKGNHDYWWQSLGKVRKALPPGMVALQNDALRVGGVAICGTRGWNLPGSPGYDEAEDGPHFRRETERLRLSLQALRALPAAPCRLAIFHYPPLLRGGGPTEFTTLLEAERIPLCVYGHLHRGESGEVPEEGEFRGVRYVNASCDFIDFTPRLLLELP